MIGTKSKRDPVLDWSFDRIMCFFKAKLDYGIAYWLFVIWGSCVGSSYWTALDSLIICFRCIPNPTAAKSLIQIP